MNLNVENFHIFILVLIALLVFVCILNYYTRSKIDYEVTMLKKRLKRLQTYIFMKEHESESKSLEFTEKFKDLSKISPLQSIDDDSDENRESDGDSYLDPMKSM